MIGFWLVNLLVPGDPSTFTIRGGKGLWDFAIAPNFITLRPKVEEGMCAHTYCATHAVSLRTDGSGPVEDAFKELVPIVLAASYLTGSTVTIDAAHRASEISFIALGDHFPRQRSTTGFGAVVNTVNEFVSASETFLHGYSAARNTENILVITHFLMDALSCWSLEDLYLSLMTIFEMLKQTQRRRQGNPGLWFYDAIANAAAHYNLPVLSRDFLNMRNDLTHDGTLSGSHFPGKTKQDGAAVAAEALNWLDEYIHAAVMLGQPKRKRFSVRDLERLHAYSL